MRLIGYVDGGMDDYGATARIVKDTALEDTINERRFSHLSRHECEGETVSGSDAAVAWCIQSGVSQVIVTNRISSGTFPHCRRARVMRFE